jgi:organic radical activating enzyme
MVTIYSDGTKIKETLDPMADHFTYDFPENFDIKITDQCDGGCVYCHENSTVNGKHGDLRALEPMIATLHSGTECAIGGGNALAHPDLVWFLERLKEQGVIANITINQRHLKPYKELICKIVGDGLVHGIGISLTDSSNKEDFDFIDTLGENVVIHTIAGILTAKDLPALRDRKVLILGYKDLRRGHAMLEKHRDEIQANINWLKFMMMRSVLPFTVMSFDCLGIEQLDPKTALNISDNDFNTLFQGSDTDVKDADGNITCATMYIDVPNMQVARMSTAALDKRYPFTGKENIHDLLQVTTKGW